MKLLEKDFSSKLRKSGIRAIHANGESIPGGKDKVNITPERIALGILADLTIFINSHALIEK